MALNIPAGITAGTIVVNGASDLPVSPTPGTRVYRLDVNKSYEWNGGQWVSRSDTADNLNGWFTADGSTFVADNFRVVGGLANIGPVDSAGRGSLAITFPVTFTRGALVFVTPHANGTPVVASADGASFTGVTLRLQNDVPGVTRAVSWFALGTV